MHFPKLYFWHRHKVIEGINKSDYLLLYPNNFQGKENVNLLNSLLAAEIQNVQSQ